MKNDIRFILERYHAGGANRYVCPQCGRKKCFTRYVDLETGEYVADDCGKCDHALILRLSLSTTSILP